MGVDVDEARCDQRAVGVDRAVRRARDLADCHDPISFDRDIARETGPARSVDDRATPDHHVMRHGLKRSPPEGAGILGPYDGG